MLTVTVILNKNGLTVQCCVCVHRPMCCAALKNDNPSPPNPYISEMAFSCRFQKVYTYPPPGDDMFARGSKSCRNYRKVPKPTKLAGSECPREIWCKRIFTCATSCHVHTSKPAGNLSHEGAMLRLHRIILPPKTVMFTTSEDSFLLFTDYTDCNCTSAMSARYNTSNSAVFSIRGPTIMPMHQSTKATTFEVQPVVRMLKSPLRSAILILAAMLRKHTLQQRLFSPIHAEVRCAHFSNRYSPPQNYRTKKHKTINIAYEL